MYLEHFGLKESPFRLSPDPHFLYLSKHHARAKAYLDSTVVLEDGFVIITGEVGSGKTTLMKCFMESLGENVIYAHIAQTQLTPVQFLQCVLADFGFKPFKKRKAELLDMLNHFLVDQYSAGNKVLLIVDEAQNLSSQVLEEVRLLSGVETSKDKVLRIILAGQPELNQTLDSDNMRQLVQRARLRFHLGPLSERETREYVTHRLQIAGAGEHQIFDQELFPTIFRFSGGIPRLINTLCDTAMLCAFAEEKDTVGSSDLTAAIEELGWSEYAATTNSFAMPDMSRINDPSADEIIGTLFVLILVAGFPADALFAGDTLFMPDSGTARCDFPGGDARRLYRSIQRLFRLPDATRVFVCHDYQPNGRSLQYVAPIKTRACKAAPKGPFNLSASVGFVGHPIHSTLIRVDLT